MKRKYIHMSMLIQGPKQPGNDINLYLQLLRDELHKIWTEGVNTWDAVAEDYFPMRAALITTVQDYLGYGYIAGQAAHGHCACVSRHGSSLYGETTCCRLVFGLPLNNASE